MKVGAALVSVRPGGHEDTLTRICHQPWGISASGSDIWHVQHKQQHTTRQMVCVTDLCFGFDIKSTLETLKKSHVDILNTGNQLN